MIRVFLQGVFLLLSIAVSWLAASRVASRLRDAALPPTTVEQSLQSQGSNAPQTFALDDHPLTEFPETSARPVFFKGRRFPASGSKLQYAGQPAQTLAVAAIGADTLKLMGVLIEGQSKKALISGSDKIPRWYGESDTIESWSLLSVRPNAVVVSRGGAQTTLRLYEVQFDVESKH